MADFREKIKPLDELAHIAATLKAQGKKIALCHGVFDLLHPGHIRHFDSARKFADILVVTLTRDAFVNKGPGRPAFPEALRAEGVAALSCVDFVALNDPESTALPAIQKIRPDFYVKGGEYENLQGGVTGGRLKEKSAVESYGGQMVFTHDITFSSTNLLNQFFSIYPEDARQYLQKMRGHYHPDQVMESLEKVKKLKVLVIGDAVVDEYHYTHPLGKSGKESLVATKWSHQESYAGGVFALANHAAGFCESVTVLTCLGAKESHEPFIREHLKPNVTPAFFYRDDVVTTVKRRFLDAQFFTKLFESYYFDDSPLPEAVEAQVWRYLAERIREFDCVIVLDYAHGFLSPHLINFICGTARHLAVNTQTNAANTGFNPITKYPRLDYACLSEPELRLSLHDRHGDLESLVRKISEQLGARRVMVTRGPRGALCYAPESGFFPVPALSRNVVDRVGAGDALLGVTAPCVAAGLPMDLVGFIGGVTGAMAVAIVGNKSSIEFKDLSRSIKSMLS